MASFQEQDNLADLRWSSPHPVEPYAGFWRIAKAPDPADYHVPAPPANDSRRTEQELAELLHLSHSRTPDDVAQILRWSVQDFSPVTHWAALAEEMIRRYALNPMGGARVHFLLNEAVYCSMVACWANKFRYLRPRPTMLDPTIDISVIPVPQHPSYPAGHSTTAGAAAAILKHFFPADADIFTTTAQDSGLSRLKAGIHYRSDHLAGLKLGRRVAADLLNAAAHDGGPEEYLPAPG
ncbi:MAG TPA: vanadium-dependent haloperoxidase [Symbiobacteriaceae bacterium]|jgi:hypothetical protein